MSSPPEADSAAPNGGRARQARSRSLGNGPGNGREPRRARDGSGGGSSRTSEGGTLTMCLAFRGPFTKSGCRRVRRCNGGPTLFQILL